MGNRMDDGLFVTGLLGTPQRFPVHGEPFALDGLRDLFAKTRGDNQSQIVPVQSGQ